MVNVYIDSPFFSLNFLYSFISTINNIVNESEDDEECFKTYLRVVQLNFFKIK